MKLKLVVESINSPHFEKKLRDRFPEFSIFKITSWEVVRGWVYEEDLTSKVRSIAFFAVLQSPAEFYCGVIFKQEKAPGPVKDLVVKGVELNTILPERWDEVGKDFVPPFHSEVSGWVKGNPKQAVAQGITYSTLPPIEIELEVEWKI